MTLKIHAGRIRTLADMRGFGSVADMANQFGISKQQLYKILDGSYLPSLPTAIRMAKKLGVTVEDLCQNR